MTDIQLITMDRIYEMQPGTKIKTRCGVMTFQSWACHPRGLSTIICYLQDESGRQDIMGERLMLESTENLEAVRCAYCGKWVEGTEVVDQYFCSLDCFDCADMSRD